MPARIRSPSATAPYVASQGTRLGRLGRPRIERDADGTVWVGGSAITCIQGEVEIEASPSTPSPR